MLHFTPVLSVLAPELRPQTKGTGQDQFFNHVDSTFPTQFG
nr:MAG TPA: hypothetical protein [Caudoviricetes sp.]